ncbi:CgeB family protein [Gulosibacter sp. ACHW.36C]|uniref:Glycosyltransferase n=1 Tax=Gulosibacter sediminis TaxID=1729695 RepID=A0ABY4MXE0_9MICO|nr:glycosyltransferase [Gulosibacter sediminis]UQN15095.1 glycosyltransferase [Gulosibacter sediminis]
MTLDEVVSDAIRLEPGTSPYLSIPGNTNGVIVSILDEFSQSSFRHVSNLHAIGPVKPELDLDRLDPAALLVESAWNGNQGRWRYMVTSSKGPKPPFHHLLAECNKRGIPTIFWNKEDPVHYDEFIDAAKLFDYVLTTDGDLVPTYKEAIGHDRVDLLRFAAEPHIHNPRRVTEHRRGDIAFAGQYFRHKYPERRMQVETLFSAAQNHDFSIYSRMLGSDENYQFPKQYQHNIVGSLPYTEMVSAYKRHKIFLNVNSVTSSTTMCARRVFELAAAKTIVVSMHSDAIRSVFPADEVATVGSVEEAAELFDLLLTDSLGTAARAQRAWRRVATSHTMRDRVEQIRNMIGISIPHRSANIALHASTESLTRDLIEDLASQTILEFPSATITVFTHGQDSSKDPQLPTHITISPSEDFRARDFDYVGHVDGSLRYGKNYISDQILVLDKFIPEAIVTKPLWSPNNELPKADETDVTWVQRGAWISRSDAETLNELILSSVSATTPIVDLNESAPAYCADVFNVVPAENSYDWMWTA